MPSRVVCHASRDANGTEASKALYLATLTYRPLSLIRHFTSSCSRVGMIPPSWVSKWSSLEGMARAKVVKSRAATFLIRC
ncbi:hypothetical protein [Streptomyces lydicus]